MNLKLEINEKRTASNLITILLGVFLGLTIIGSTKMQKELVELRKIAPKKVGF